MDGSDFNWKKSRAQQRRKEKRKKDFSCRNKNIQQDQKKTTFPDKTEESSDVTPYKIDVPKEKHDIKSGFSDDDTQSKKSKDSKEKPVIDFSNLKRETEEIEKLMKKNQYEISSNWERYVGSGKENSVYDSEEPSDILRLLQSPGSYGGHFLLKEEQDWAVTSKMVLSGCFALDLKRLAQGLSCIPFHMRQGLPESLFSVEEIEQMTHGLTKRHEDYFSSITEETVTDKNRSVRENVSNKNILLVSKGDSRKTSIKQGETLSLDDTIIYSSKKQHTSADDSDNIVEKNNTLSLEKCLERVVTLSKTNQSPQKGNVSFEDKNKTEHTVDASLNRYLYDETERKYLRNPSPVDSETFNSCSSVVRDCRIPEETTGLFCKTVASNSPHINERQNKNESMESVFSSGHNVNVKENNRAPSGIQIDKKSEDGNLPYKQVSTSSTSENKKQENTLQKIRKYNSATEFDFLLSVQDPVKKQSAVNIHQKSSGKAYMPAPKVTTTPNKTEKDECLEDWLDSVLNE